VLVLHQAGPGALVRLLDGGAADVMAAPVDVAELVARLEARVRAQRAGAAAASESEEVSRLLDGFLEVAAAIRPEEVFHALVRQVGAAIPVAECACIVAGPDQLEGRLVATSGDPRLRDQAVSLDQYPEVRDAIRTGTRASTARSVALPILQQGQPIGAVLIRGRDGRLPGRERLDFVERLVTGAGRVLESQHRFGAMMRRATAAGSADPLTGCASLDQLDRRLMEEFDRARRYDLRFSLVLLDIDGLDAVNQRDGTEAGDRLLVALGAVLSRELRASDFVARYGGDEFAIVLPETGIDGARDLIARVRDRLAASLGDARAPGLTAGVATFPSAAALLPEDLFAMAESALLAAKRDTGTRVGEAA
jgi:diguanylate cyclase (GGDEF)-like protein